MNNKNKKQQAEPQRNLEGKLTPEYMERMKDNPQFHAYLAKGLSEVEAAMLADYFPFMEGCVAAGIKYGLRQLELERSRMHPEENGAQPAGVVTHTDPAHMSKAQRRDIRERVRRGENISF